MNLTRDLLKSRLTALRWVRALGAFVMLWGALPTNTVYAQSIETLTSRPAHLPPIHRVQNHALRAAGLTLHATPLARMRLSNLVPTVELDLGWGRRDDEESRYREDINRLGEGALSRDFIRQDAHRTQDHTRTIRVRLKLDLSRVIFDPRELQWTRLRAQRNALRADLMREVATLYWRRRHHELEFAITPSHDIELRIKHHVQMQLCSAQLDALTRGWFSRAVAQRARKGGTP